ncbi:major facilitator superfamily domain-containing protein 6 isoform X2 [Daktulosphaira vitifoliae]|uniref:major facilitator superfamily domain-containing protein 6 isoform X2 n=1 Tax=Daktulosphaira vitifoliae TaxID=58002 RepID=UPI0021AA3B7B|nr:major facilitator superfamily domain-containing protein 6 isoform X2 [Daktulosphaira vitifoliae]
MASPYEVPRESRGPALAAAGVRPRVDPEALGEVDPEQYPEAKESTNKIRGKSDLIELIFGEVDQELLTVKTFYFFFYSAFGSLFPLMGVYFKQMGMNPSQCGILIGSRPFVEFLAAPFWGGLADRWRKGKLLLLASLSCWIIFTLPLNFTDPPPTKCLVKVNQTTYMLETPNSQKIYKRDLSAVSLFLNESYSNEYNDTEMADLSLPVIHRTRRGIRPRNAAGKSPISVSFASNYNPKEHYNLVYPSHSHNVYQIEDIEKSVFLILLLVMIGEFFSAPAITLADSAVITLLGADADKYGHQRMFGSLGWGLSMFFVGIALDHSTAFPNHPCGGPQDKEKNYTICFATFSVLMGAALITATQMNFRHEESEEEQQTVMMTEKSTLQPTKDDYMQQELAQQLNLPSLAPSAAGLPPRQQEIPAIEEPTLKTKIFAQTTKKIPEWVTVLKYFANLKCGSFLFVSWFMGFGIGLIFTFLFWHLQDYGGSPTLFGVASVINHISEIFAYFFSFKLIRQMGHVKVLCLGLAGNILRFLYISWLKNPWWVLPFEFMQGITHAAVWAACCSYIAHNTPQQLRSSAQGVLQGIHHGLGRGCGAVIGGMFVSQFGTTTTFRGYGFVCALVLAAFVFINFYRKDTGFVSELPVAEDPHQVAEETAHLAPHGVPSNPIPRGLSSSKLQDLASENHGYGATHTSTGGNLNIPQGPNNPFRQHNAYQQPNSNFGKVYTDECISKQYAMCNDIQKHSIASEMISPEPKKRNSPLYQW